MGKLYQVLDMNFQKLIELREDFSLKQKDIANVLNITQQTYSLWENGTKIIPLKHLNSLCNYYDVSMDYVLGLSNVRQYDIVNRVIDKKVIGIKLKEFRKKQNITQEELANILNTTHSTISAYESGKTTILTAFAYEICKRYNISMDYLCGRTRQINYLVFIYNRKNYRHKSIAYIIILILETTGSKILLKTLDFKSK